MTYSQVIYLVLDEIKAVSDDATFEEEHVLFLMQKFRAFLLKQRYADVRNIIPNANKQTIAVSLTADPEETTIQYLSSDSSLPKILKIGEVYGFTRIFIPTDRNTKINLVPIERFPYVGFAHSPLPFVYAAIEHDNTLVVKTVSTDVVLTSLNVTAVFSHPQDAWALRTPTDNVSDIRDAEFPLEDALVPPLVELIVKELHVAEYNPDDSRNNARDDLADVNMK